MRGQGDNGAFFQAGQLVPSKPTGGPLPRSRGSQAARAPTWAGHRGGSSVPQRPGHRLLLRPRDPTGGAAEPTAIRGHPPGAALLHVGTQDGSHLQGTVTIPKPLGPKPERGERLLNKRCVWCSWQEGLLQHLQASLRETGAQSCHRGPHETPTQDIPRWLLRGSGSNEDVWGKWGFSHRVPSPRFLQKPSISLKRGDAAVCSQVTSQVERDVCGFVTFQLRYLSAGDAVYSHLPVTPRGH